MEIVLSILALYYGIGLVLCGIIYAFIYKEYGGMSNLAKLGYTVAADVADSMVFKLTVAFLFVTICPFIVPPAVIRGLWRERKEIRSELD